MLSALAASARLRFVIRFGQLVPEWREDIKDLRGKHGDKVL